MMKIFKSILFTVMFTVLFFGNSIIANAEEKMYNVTLEEKYSCVLWVQSQDTTISTESWSVRAISPTNEEYLFILDKSHNAYYCKFDYLQAGAWKIILSSDTAIPTAQIKITNDVIEDNGNITVTKAVAGLKIYVVDNKAVVEWTDETVGNLVINVFNTDTFQVIANEKVNGNYYECEFDDTVSKITVSVVPANAQKVEGAEQTVTLNANYVPKGEVVFPEYTTTNVESFPFTLKLKQVFDIIVEVNGVQMDIGTKNEGEHTDVSAILESGENEVKVYLVEENGSRKSFSTNVIYDITKPVIEPDKAYDGLVTSQNSIVIEGVVRDFEKLTIDGVEQTVMDNGRFKCECGLVSGINHIEIKATDSAGNETTYVANIKVAPKNNASLISSIIQLVLCIVVIVLLVIFVPKMWSSSKPKEKENKKNGREEE